MLKECGRIVYFTKQILESYNQIHEFICKYVAILDLGSVTGPYLGDLTTC